MKKFLCYDTNDAASGKIDVDSRGVLYSYVYLDKQPAFHHTN